MTIKTMLPEAIGVSVLTSVDVLSAASVATVLLSNPVPVDMLVLWLGVVTLDVDIVNAESDVLGIDGIRSDTLLLVLCFVVEAGLAVVVAPLSSVAFIVVV